MAGTPEGKIKKQVNALLDQYKPIYRYWPVPSGFGASSLDCIVCYLGFFIAIETKAPGKKPTPRQEFCMDEMREAHGTVFVVDSEQTLALLKQHLNWLKATYANNR